MKMKFKERYQSGLINNSFSKEELVDRAVYNSSCYIQGEIETLRAEVVCLTKLVGMLVAHLPDDALLEVADRFRFNTITE